MILRRGVVLVLFAAAATAFAPDLRQATAATQRHVSGIITSVGTDSMTIALPQGNRTVTGRLDARRTHVTVNGRAAQVGDLKVTYDARAELGLDEVWISVRATRD